MNIGLSGGLWKDNVNALTASDINLFAGINRGGVWKRPLSEMTFVKEIPGKLPHCFVLKQNYPNPFNPTTTIHYDTPKNTHVKILVFDLLGRQIESLVDEFKTIGNYKIEFNARDLSSGIYFYQIQTNEFNETKKLILLK